MIKIIILLGIVFVAYMGITSLEQRSLYFPDRQMVATPAVCRLEFEDVDLKTTDGLNIKGWFVPGKSPTMLFCHGNAGNISHRLDKLQIYHKIGLSVFIFDYRGYGQSEGTPTEAGTYADAEAAYRYLTETRKIPASQIILYGESLGCAVATEMAIRHPAAALILESPFTSTIAMGKLVFPWLPGRLIIRYHYDNLSKIPNLKMPLLILHSPADDIVPFDMGRQLYAAAPEPKRFFELSGDHNGGYLTTGNRYVQAMGEFLKTLKLKQL